MPPPATTPPSNVPVRDDSARDLLTAELRGEVHALRRIRDGEARRLEARIADLERLVPELWRRGRRIEELEADLERESRARHDAEATTEVLRTEIEVLRRALDAERARRGPPDVEKAPAPAERSAGREARFGEDRPSGDEHTARLRRRLQELRFALEEKETRIARLARRLSALEPEDEEPDDLTRISGIGPVIAGILRDQGITGVADLAALDAAGLDRLRRLVPVYPGRIEDDRWIEQARAMVADREERRRRREGWS